MHDAALCVIQCIDVDERGGRRLYFPVNMRDQSLILLSTAT